MKKLLALLLAGMMVFSFAACGKDEKKEEGAKDAPKQEEVVEETPKTKLSLLCEAYEEDGKMISVDFFYPEEKGFKEVETVYGEQADWKKLTDKDETVNINFYLAEDTTYAANAETDKEYADNYVEFKVGGKDAYAYSGFGAYTIVVLLENVSENFDRYATISIESTQWDAEKSMKIYKENKDIQEIVDSLVYNGLVEAEVPADEPIEEDVVEEEATEEIVE